MLTIFSTAKPFTGHSNIIQRNALKSWTLLHPDVEVILFGDDAGAAEVCQELGIRHEPHVKRSETGTKYLNYMFDRAFEISRHPFLCYSNCDIMLMSDFCAALEITARAHQKFLLVGRRWNTPLAVPWDFAQQDWEQRLRSLALSQGHRCGPSWVDYFCFSRSLYRGKMPPFLIGRNGWDPWLMWFACANKVPVVDVGRSVVAVHQNHDYSYLHGVPNKGSTESGYNWLLVSPYHWHHYTLDSANEVVSAGRLRRHRMPWFGPLKSRIHRVVCTLWFAALNATRPLRHRLGIRKNATLSAQTPLK